MGRPLVVEEPQPKTKTNETTSCIDTNERAESFAIDNKGTLLDGQSDA